MHGPMNFLPYPDHSHRAGEYDPYLRTVYRSYVQSYFLDPYRSIGQNFILLGLILIDLDLEDSPKDLAHIIRR